MVVFTASNTLDIFDPKHDTNAVLFKKNEYYILKREKNNPITIVPCSVSIVNYFEHRKYVSFMYFV